MVYGGSCGFTCISECPPHEVCMQAPPFQITVPGAIMSCSNEPVYVECTSPCGGWGGFGGHGGYGGHGGHRGYGGHGGYGCYGGHGGYGGRGGFGCHGGYGGFGCGGFGYGHGGYGYGVRCGSGGY